MKDGPQTLGKYFGEFIERCRVKDGETFHLIVTDEDCLRLGEFFIRGMVGWASDYQHDRELQTASENSTDIVGKELQ